MEVRSLSGKAHSHTTQSTQPYTLKLATHGLTSLVTLVDRHQAWYEQLRASAPGPKPTPASSDRADHYDALLDDIDPHCPMCDIAIAPNTLFFNPLDHLLHHCTPHPETTAHVTAMLITNTAERLQALGAPGWWYYCDPSSTLSAGAALLPAPAHSRLASTAHSIWQDE